MPYQGAWPRGGPQQIWLQSEVKGWEEEAGGRTDQRGGNRVHPGAWDWQAPEGTAGYHNNPVNPVTALHKDTAGAWGTRCDTVPGRSEELRQW